MRRLPEFHLNGYKVLLNLRDLSFVTSSFLFLVVRPGAPSSVLALLVAMPFAPSSVLCSSYQESKHEDPFKIILRLSVSFHMAPLMVDSLDRPRSTSDTHSLSGKGTRPFHASDETMFSSQAFNASRTANNLGVPVLEKPPGLDSVR